MSDNDQAPIDWDAPAPILGYIDPDLVRQARADQLARHVENQQAIAQMVSGHSMYLEILSATIDDGEISMSARWHGQVQRPGVIARPTDTGVVSIRIKATVEQPADEPAPEPETTRDRIQQRSDLR